MLNRLLTVLLLISNVSYGQAVDSLNVGRRVDADDKKSEYVIDSIKHFAGSEFKTIESSYDSITVVAAVQTSRINRKIDSLQNLTQPVDHLTQKLDSINRWKTEIISKLASKVEQLKVRVNNKIAQLDVPDELKGRVSELTGALDKLDLSVPDANLPISLSSNIDLDLPSLNVPGSSEMMPKLTADNIPKIELGSTGEQIQQYQQQLTQVPKNMDQVAELAENKTASLSEVANVQSELGEINKLNELVAPLKDQEAMKEKLMQEVKHQAMDHMAGQQEKLMNAMETLAKYKQQYTKVTGLDELPKKKPNEMRGKALKERLLPGLALQIQRKDTWMVDVNAYVGYRFNSRLSVGGGWNQRIAYNNSANQFVQDLTIYGPRVFGEYAIGKGFSGRLETEYMNTWVPPKFSSGQGDPNGREWVFGAMAGIKKDYTIYKSIKGTLMAMYNLYDPKFKSPYSNKLNMRIGFEFPMRKKK